MAAAHWLVDGHDGEALRALAGLGAHDFYEIGEVLTDALAECGVSVPDSDDEALHVEYLRIAIAFQRGELTVAEVVGGVREANWATYEGGDLLMTAIHHDSLLWHAVWEPTEEYKADLVRTACAEELAYTWEPVDAEGPVDTEESVDVDEPAPARGAPGWFAAFRRRWGRR
ncbi:hypothetical protein V5P93_002021 [Actinokineospora auranticolor]|uniref:DUF4240 domain-containing protein n=1 Tax=Actinokineospora auranticolor TaxID=155976 RepID=A0A2S6GCK8_9PSEU|nr:hypothetical protein [Actinokineospora auranticolor]PPK62589.1 hypothetical protein CLV40_13451 [Actinokineospora auranticolor]